MNSFVVSKQIFAVLIFLVLASFSMVSLAAVEAPYLELEFLPGDNRVTLTTAAIKTLTLEGQVTAIFTDNTTFTDIPDEPFSLTTTIASSIPDGSGNYLHIATGGTLNVDNGNLLSANLTNISLFSTTFNQHIFSADLIYTGGSLIPNGVNSGRIEGNFTGPLATLSTAYISNGTELINAKVGAISPVPIPAAIWLFGSALLMLFGFRKISLFGFTSLYLTYNTIRSLFTLRCFAK